MKILARIGWRLPPRVPGPEEDSDWRALGPFASGSNKRGMKRVSGNIGSSSLADLVVRDFLFGLIQVCGARA